MQKVYSYHIFFEAVITIILLIGFPSAASCKDETMQRKSDTDGIEAGEMKYREGKDAEAIKIFMEVAEKAHEEHDYKLECLANYNIGVVYISLLSNGEALQYFQKAYDLCIRHKLGAAREVEIINGIAGAFFQSHNYTKAKTTLSQALKIAKANNDSMMIALCASDMALICNKTNAYDSVGYWIGVSKKYSVSEKSNLQLLSIAAETAMLRKDYLRAEEMCKEILSSADKGDANRGLAYTYLMKIASDRGDWEQAMLMEKGGEKENSLNMKTHFFEIAAEMYMKRGDYKRAMQYKDSLIIYNDSLEVINNRQLLDSENIKLEVLKYQQQLDRELQRQKYQTWVWITIAIIFFFIVVISVMFLRNQHQRYITQQEMLALKLDKEHKEKELAEERMHEMELIAEHEQEILKKEIERKNTQMQANAMFVSARNELICDLLKHLDDLGEENQEIRNLRSYLGRLLGRDSKEQEEFMMNVEAADPELSRRLLAIHPDLLQSDIKFLSYVKMNMNMKEMAAILNVNPDSCKRRKIRISKKLGLASSADLYSYLINLSDDKSC